MNLPPIIASLSPQNYQKFFGSISGYQDILAEIQRTDPGLPYADLVEKINLHRSAILLTGWGSTPIEPNFMKDCPTIRYVCHVTGELRWLLPRTLIEEGLLVTNWGGVISDSVAEGALFLILACCRRATDVVMTLHVRRGWDLSGKAPVSLLDKRVGIHGFGNVAQQLALLLKPFRCVISAYSPPVPDTLFEAYAIQRAASLENLFENNDVIVELEALTNHTERLVDKNLLSRIKPGGIFVNAGRGKIVREPDLEEVAAQGKIFIGLDVYSQEPLPSGSPLRGLANVFLTPHFAGPTPDRLYLCGEHALANIRAFFQGDPLESVIGVAEYNRMT